MFNVDLKAVCSTYRTDTQETMFLSLSKDFYCPLNYSLQENDQHIRLALAKYIGELLGLSWHNLSANFCGMQKPSNTTIEIIHYIKLPADYKSDKYSFFNKSNASGSEYVRKVTQYVF